ncbi:MAG: peptidoglycan DD-metalloendopeptidase family protein [Gallionellaceae bacterium]|nr:peptidoglycan DD-metalloendopeptidase family protein [Gallionellaceae bacterium]
MRAHLVQLIGIALGLLVVLPAAHALPREDAVPGGIALVRLGKATEAPSVWFQEKRVAVLRDRQGWVALVGLPLNLEPGMHQLRIAANGAEETKPLRIAARHYAVQRFTVPDKRKVEPLPEDELRIAREQKRIDEIKAIFRDEPDPDLAFRLPAHGKLTGNFGLRRIINGLERNPHAGIDVAAPIGTPVLAAGAGIVVETGDYFFNGNSAYIDHGQGIVTLYCHLDRVDVQPGERVAAGQRIGHSGNTGRTTGPHLHWTVLANGTAVDPRLFLPKAVK